MSIKIGSIVVVVNDFKVKKDVYKFPYPKIGEKLIVSKITEHPNKQLRKQKIVLLNFEEYPNMIGLCNKRIDGVLNFMELPGKKYTKKLLKNSKKENSFLSN